MNESESDSDSYAEPDYGSDISDELSEEEYVYSDEEWRNEGMKE